MNTPIRTSYEFSAALVRQTETFKSLWHEKLETEREMALLIAQGRDVEADAAWDRILKICIAIRYNQLHHSA
jgi:hypothetical protein